MIKSLSPYYVTIPFVSPLSGLTCTSYTLQVFVWNGAKNSQPALPVYEFTKSNPTGSTLTDEIDIANLISDYISFTPQEGIGTQLLEGNNQLWVKWRTFYTTTDSNDAILPSNQNTKLMTKGYSYGMDGKNQSVPSNKILISGDEFKVNRNGTFVLPVLIEETPPISYEVFIDYITSNSATSTESDINIYYSIPDFSPVNVVVQTSADNVTFSDEYTLTNTSPLTDVIVNYLIGESVYVRLKITEAMVDYFSNSVNVGSV